MAEFKIVYKSGYVQKVTADSMTVTRDTMSGDITKVEWTNMEPHSMYLGVNNIESVWEL